MLLWLSFTAASQQLPAIKPEQPLYIDVNDMGEQRSFEVKDHLMSFQYQDMKGAGELTLKVYNWKLELAAEFWLDKSLGLNQYSIELDRSGVDLSSGSTFHRVLNDKTGSEFKWLIRDRIKREPKEIIPKIIVKPIEINCTELSKASVIEFYGDATGGNEPYKMSWYVLNDARTTLLYQPKEDNLESRTGTLSMITVDKSPAYSVMLQVSDACGNLGEKMVHITCEDNKKKISTIFVDPLPLPPKKVPIGKEVLPIITQ